LKWVLYNCQNIFDMEHYYEIKEILQDMENLVEEHKDYSMQDLEEKSRDFEKKMIDLIETAEHIVSDMSYDYDKMKRESDDNESEKDDLEEQVSELEERLKYEPVAENLYDQMKKEICLNIYNNLNLEELIKLEHELKSNKKCYTT